MKNIKHARIHEQTTHIYGWTKAVHLHIKYNKSILLIYTSDA